MSICYYENISARRSFKSTICCNMQCIKQQLPRAFRIIKNYYGMRNMVWSESRSRGDFIWLVLLERDFDSHKWDRTSRRFNEPDSDIE